MGETDMMDLLAAVAAGTVSAREALGRLNAGPFRRTDLGYSQPDHHRRLRHGLNEVVYGESKTAEQILGIVAELAGADRPVLVTRLQPEKLAALRERYPDGRANPVARTFIVHAPVPEAAVPGTPHVAIVAAGTSDLPVAEEAGEVCVAMATPHLRICDVGVAGLHRILGVVDTLQAATAVVVIAGMEGALPSVVAGLVGRPIIAVPTSVGYGVSFGGVTALLAMLNSCAPGVTVTNIDNGFSAGFAACQIVRAARAAALDHERSALP
jgi:NCAIR mutase (PurE)-related protein